MRGRFATRRSLLCGGVAARQGFHGAQNVSRETRLALYRDYTSWLYQTKQSSTGIFHYYALHNSGKNI